MWENMIILVFRENYWYNLYIYRINGLTKETLTTLSILVNRG